MYTFSTDFKYAARVEPQRATVQVLLISQYAESIGSLNCSELGKVSQTFWDIVIDGEYRLAVLGLNALSVYSIIDHEIQHACTITLVGDLTRVQWLTRRETNQVALATYTSTPSVLSIWKSNGLAVSFVCPKSKLLWLQAQQAYCMLWSNGGDDVVSYISINFEVTHIKLPTVGANRIVASVAGDLVAIGDLKGIYILAGHDVLMQTLVPVGDLLWSRSSFDTGMILCPTRTGIQCYDAILQQLYVLRLTHNGPVYTMGWRSYDSTLKVLNETEVPSVYLSCDSRYLVAHVPGSEIVWIWDVTCHPPELETVLQQPQTVRRLEWVPGSLVMYLPHGGSVGVWSPIEGPRIVEFALEKVQKVHFSDSRYIGSNQSDLDLWGNVHHSGHNGEDTFAYRKASGAHLIRSSSKVAL